jgi:hypothetical protein
MDISKISGKAGISGRLQQRNGGKSQDFGKVLDKAMDHIGQAYAGGDCEVSGASPVSPTRPPEMVSPSQDVFRQAHRVLDLMDEYANALSDPTRTLRSIEPIVRDIQAEMKGMPEGASSSDEGLKNIVNDIAVMASVEAMKFHRGDYLS